MPRKSSTRAILDASRYDRYRTQSDSAVGGASFGSESIKPLTQFSGWPRILVACIKPAYLLLVPNRKSVADDIRKSARTVAAGRARSPAEISKRGWRDVLTMAFRSLVEQETSLAAAGIAFYIVWALFPALVVTVVVVARLVGRGRVLALLAWLKLDLPQSLSAVVLPQLDVVARHSGAVSAATLVGGSVLAIWAGMRGSRGLMTALNTVYGAREKRSVWHRTAIELVLAFLGGIFLAFVLTTIVLVAADARTGAPGVVLLAPSRWPVLIVAMMLLLAVSYRYGPCRPLAKWRWVTWGAAVGSAIWVVGSFAFAYITEHVVHANPLLGSLGSVVLFLFWIYLTVLVILLGAHINAQLEEHTAVDTRAEKR